MRCSIGMERDCRPGIFDDVAARAGDADFRDDSKGDILGGDMRRQLAVEPDQHRLRPLHRDHLRREDMRELGRAAAERQRSDASDRAGVAVRHRMRRARQHHAKLRRDDVRNALLRIVKIEHLDLVPGAALAHRLEKGRARRIGVVVAAGLGGDGVIHRRKRQIGPAHRPMLLLKLLESMRRVQFVQHMTVDVDQLAAVGALRATRWSSQILSNRVCGMNGAFGGAPSFWSPARSKASMLARLPCNG